MDPERTLAKRHFDDPNDLLRHFRRNCCGGITYKFCARVEMMSSVAD
jgi:hypothetical protein